MADKLKNVEIAKCKEIGRSCACYNLRRAARAITRLYERYLSPSGLKATQFTALMAAHLRGPITLTKLADLTVTERTTLTRNLNILESKGFLSIEAGRDRRERLVTITEKGRETLMAAIPLWEVAQTHIEKGLGKDRLESFLGGLSEITSLSRNP
ncbi:MAG: MarR family transcriptional regulator [Deltaproteobacteria bacterium]|nr:MarR family transcriptional regulator [Deltaproteobacteria bacterium]